MNKRLIIFVAAVALATQTLGAQDKGPVKISLTANAPPVPALRFALLPELRDQVPGNAAPLYRKAGELLQKVPERGAIQTLFDQWTATPLDQLPRDEVRKVLALYKEPLAVLEKATRAEYCDWELAQRLRQAGIGTLLPELQPMRQAAQVLRVRARLELADNRPDLALRTLRCHFTMAKHVGESPTLIGHLVGIAIEAIACSTLAEVMAHPQAANLYWTLASLPQPFFDFRKPFEGERLSAYGTFPGSLELAQNLEAGPLSEEQLAKIVKITLSVSDNNLGEAVLRVVLAQLIRSKHETAKKALIAAGRPRDKVEQWPHVQVALMHALAEYDRFFDEMLKCQTLPYWEAEPALGAIEKRLKDTRLPGPNGAALPLARLLLPGVGKVTLARHRVQRQLNALRCLEAIRLYAAEHKGQLPATLAEIKDVSVPMCPVTGRPFLYHRTGDSSATLTAPPARKLAPSIPPLSYELTLRR